MEKLYKSYWEQNIKKPRYLHRKAKFLLHQKSRKSLCFSYIHSYINYGKIAWETTCKTKLKKIFTYQRKAVRAIFFCRPSRSCPTTDAWHECTQCLPNKYISKFDSSHTGTAPSIFFNHNYNYLTISKNSGNYLNWQWNKFLNRQWN